MMKAVKVMKSKILLIQFKMKIKLKNSKFNRLEKNFDK